jgi:F420H(2)-dependent quinone reductase
MSREHPPVEGAPPPRALVRGLNIVLRRLLRSPLHTPFSKRLMLLIVTGRKTGCMYVVPVGRHETNGEFLVGAMGAWRENLRGGAAVRLVIDGRTHVGHAELEEDPDEVARGYKVLLDQLGRKPRDVGLKVNLRRSPTLEELKPALTGRRIVRVRLED